MTRGWWWWPAGSDGGGPPVLFFPPAGADQTVVRPLLNDMAGLRLGVLRLPGRGPRHDERPPESLPDLVAAVSDTIGPAPVLVGHSFGGLLAYAVAAELERRGGRVARLIALASTSPAAWQRELDRDPGPDRAAFVARRTARILDSGGVPDVLGARAEFRDRLRETVAADAALSHQGFGTGMLHCPVTAVRARDDTIVASNW